MLSIHEIEEYFRSADPHLLEIVLELRNVIASVAPTATEMIQWKGISYFDAERGGTVSGGICQVHIVGERVRLGFIHGAFLRDPKHLLTGNRKVKRYLEIDSYESAPWEDIRALIKESSEFDPYSLKI
jgi:hypothetical protein